MKFESNCKAIDPIRKLPLLFQSDFDGTLTEEDISFLILDEFAEGDWRAVLHEYQAGKISVGAFNSRTFAMVKKDRDFLTRFIKEKAKLRPGLNELLEYCRTSGIRFAIVSNGLDFYIRALMERYRLNGTAIVAARTVFTPNGIDARYYSPQGQEMTGAFKESYTRLYIQQGFDVIYAGNGPSDIPASKLAGHTFATGTLLDYYTSEGLKCCPFADLNDVLRGLKEISAV